MGLSIESLKQVPKRLYKTSEIMLNIGLGLVLSNLFTQIVYRGIFKRVDVTHWSDTNKPNVVIDKVASLIQGEGIISLYSFHLIDTILLVGIALNLVRLLHSFILLLGDQAYYEIVESKGWKLRIPQFITQLLILLGSLYFVVNIHPSNKKIIVWGLLLTICLLVWDGCVWLCTKELSKFKNQQQQLLCIFHRWFKMEMIMALVACIATFLWFLCQALMDIDASNHTLCIVLKSGVALFLYIVFIIDYMWNYDFYIGKLKLYSQAIVGSPPATTSSSGG